MKRALVISISVAVITASLFFTYTNLSPGRTEERLNVLVVSLCSFRLANLTEYGFKGPPVAPNIDRFIAESSWVFDKMFNGVGWTSLFGFTAVVLPQQVLVDNGYDLLGTVPEWGAFQRIPHRHSDYAGADDVINDNDFEKDHRGLSEYVQAQIQKSRGPFYLNVHYKYMHYPLIDRFNKDAGWDRYLTADDKTRLDGYLAHPEKYYNKLPLLLMLTNDAKYALAHPEVKRRYPKAGDVEKREVTGLLTNPYFLNEWKESAGYAEDLQLLEKVYQGNVTYLDQVIAPLLDLFGNEELRENTIVVFSPDHGEMHMERDQLTHGNSLYDDALRVPMAVRLPGHRGRPEVIREQFDFLAVSKWLREVVEGKVAAANARERLMALQKDVLITRDCMDTQRGLRFKNKYKYFVRIADGARFLYDLEADPGETKNIASEKPEIATQMEELYWEHYPEVTSTNVYRCAPWMSVGGL